MIPAPVRGIEVDHISKLTLARSSLLYQPGLSYIGADVQATQAWILQATRSRRLMIFKQIYHPRRDHPEPQLVTVAAFAPHCPQTFGGC